MTAQFATAAEPIVFTVAAVPVAQPRQRHRLAKTADGKAFTRNYVDGKHPVWDFKASVRHAAQAAYSGPPLDVPLVLNLVFVLPRPACLRFKKRPMPRVPYAGPRNDWDNLGKSVCDALNKILWTDDGRLAQVHVERWIAAGDEQPHVAVSIATLPEA